MPYAIATGHPVTARAAEEILQAGGTAVDAAVAASAMSWVAEPLMASAGGGGFAMVHTAEGKSWLFDFFCQTPRNQFPAEEMDFFPIVVDFGSTQETFHVGKGATGAPGSIAGLFALHEQFGRIPMRELLQPAIEAAQAGVAVDAFQQLNFSLLEPILRLEARGRELFFRDDQLVGVGTPVPLPGLADFLDYLGKEGRNAFYRGEVAAKIARDFQEGGGFLRVEDLEGYEVAIRPILRCDYHGFQVLTNPLPSTGGAMLVLGLRKLRSMIRRPDLYSKAHLGQLVEIFQALQSIGFRVSDLAEALGVNGSASPSDGGKRGATTHIGIVDPWGNAVSMTASNGEGSGYFVENTDIQLNNMLGEAALLPAGFHSWLPDTRLSSLMTPSIVLEADNRLRAVIGSSGAGRIPFAILQVLHYLLDHELPVREAVNAPRAHWHDRNLFLEPGFSPAGFEQAGELQLFDEPSLFFGGAHTIAVHNGHLTAAGDERRDGAAVVRG